MKTLIIITLSIGLSGFWQANPLLHLDYNNGYLSYDMGLKIGDKAPDFLLKNVDGKKYSLKNIKDGNGSKPKGIIVVFTCNTCPFAKANEQRLIDLHQTYSKMGYPVVAIQPNNPDLKPGDSFEAMKQNSKDKEFPFLYLFDENQKVYPAFGATKTPEVFLLDQDLIVRYHGAIDDSPRNSNNVNHKFVEKAIQAIEAGDEPSTIQTKAIGCGIK